MTRKTILAVGAAGQFAGLAVTALSQLGARVRGLVRDAQQGNEAQRLGAAGLTITPRVKELMPKALLDEQIATCAIKREEVPEDVAGLVFFFTSPDAEFISGQTPNVDGGKHMG